MERFGVVILVVLCVHARWADAMLPLPECTDGSIPTCECGDGSPLDTSKFPPCDLKKGRPRCTCQGGGDIAPPPPKPMRPCNSGRPQCDDDTAVPWQLTCEGGQTATAQPGSPPSCPSGPLLCKSGNPLTCPDGSAPWS